LRNIKPELKAEADMSIERLKSSLQMTALEHQTRFSSLHAKRAEVIDQLHAELVDTLHIVRNFVLSKGHTDSDSERF